MSVLLGQPIVTKALDRLVAVGPVESVLLLGPGRTGKRTGGVELARRWLCQQDGQEVCTCRSCRTIRAGQSAEFEVVGGDDFKIDRLRDVVDRSSLWQSGRKVVMVERIDRYEPAAQTVVLKALEEPKARTTWIMTARHAPIDTIMSRSWCCRFGRLDGSTLSVLTGRPLSDIEVAMADGRNVSVRDRFIYLQFAIDRKAPIEMLPDRLEAGVLRDDIGLAANCLAEAVHHGQDRFGPFGLDRLDLDRADHVLSVLDRAVALLDANVTPWLVFELLRCRLEEI